jgi:hypothetical protein
MNDLVTAKERRQNFNFINPSYFQILKKRIRSWLLQTI